MKRFIFILLVIFIAGIAACLKAPEQPLKVFISVDMEGLAGVVSGRDCSPSGNDYEYFRRIMTLEANAAIEGALAAGAGEIVVRDGHGSKTNILPDLLHPKAKLLRGSTMKPENMMLGIDETFDAGIFIGYHAKAGTEEGIIAHTSTGNVIDLSINGVSLPEAGYNALIAGLSGVPIALVAGDNWICRQVEDLFGEVATVETKIGMGTSALCLHPDVVRYSIRSGVTGALKNLASFKPYTLQAPYVMNLKVKKEKEPYPGAKKIGEGVFSFSSSNLLEVMDAFNRMK